MKRFFKGLTTKIQSDDEVTEETPPLSSPERGGNISPSPLRRGLG
jgi:hypothetical protein